ncbi:hypothetical protein AB0O91_28615 [Kitasatospora sp. NPDC089797]|uniref:hypothetical protein n=1 Tax=Kitasatospora sp. NPDC089797 TaxID=3155298 RepID=UPI00342A414D
MLTANRVAWFAAAFVFAVPAMVLLFRSENGLEPADWAKVLLFSGSIAAVVAIVLGKGK